MNYESLNEILSAGTTNMTCLLKDSNDYDGGTLAISGVDFFLFNGNSVPRIYSHGDTYWGFGTDSVHLKVDNRDTRMRSLYREEGTLYSHYHFLKIRWEGWSYYSSSASDYQLKYDIILWDTGDISLHMISVPLQCYDGEFQFVADKTYAFTKPTTACPDVTFKYIADSKAYEIFYTPIDLPLPFKMLISDFEGVLYTIEKQVVNKELNESEDVLVALEETELTSLLFKTRGFAKIPAWDIIKGLNTPKVYTWNDSRAYSINAIVKGTPPKQYIECTADLSDTTVLGIKALNAEYTGDVTEQHSFDGESFTEEIPMSDFLTSDLDQMYKWLLESKSITFRFWLAGDATLTTFIMNYRNGDDILAKT